MIFTESSLQGALLITPEPAVDERGSFTRTFCRKEFEKRGLVNDYVQNSISTNNLKGTLRGMHYQEEPAAETKLIQCLRGAVYDVIIDLRPQSPTYRCWESFELNAAKQQVLYVPAGFAHGFVTLEDNTALYYMISAFYSPELARGVRYNDPAFGIKWPDLDLILAEKDRQWPDF
jgi:dTDP-4-dehydrorhamnose 3,5-epimerase